MEVLKCNNCNFENPLNTHYCCKCGNNISNTIEKTDIIRFLSKFIKTMVCIAFILALLGITFLNALASLSSDGKSSMGYVFIIILIVMLIISELLNKYYKNLCMKNLLKIERNDINE